MNKTEKANYNNMDVKAVYSMGLIGIEIISIEYDVDDYIIYRYMGRYHKVKIYYSGYNTENEKPYFRFYNRRIYLDECMRV